MGMFLNMLERKLKGKVDVHFIDEAHTSKTSCLSKDVNEMVKLRKKQDKSLSTNDYGGSRVKRGFYRDYRTGVFLHSDINGAVNHLKVQFSELNFSWLTKHKEKICNPIIFKESGDFAVFAA